MTTLIKAIPPSFEEGYCPDNWRDFALKLFSEAQFIFQSDVGNSFYNDGPGVPSVDNRAFLWFRTIDGRWYDWNPAYGAWTSPYWLPPDPECQLVLDWAGSESDLKEFENPGGSANPVTATTGPFWEVDHDFDQRVAIGAGTLPLSGTLIGVGTNGGLDQLALTAAQIPKHRHSITIGPEQHTTSFLPSETAEEGTFKVTGSSGIHFDAISQTIVGRTKEAGGDPTAAENKLNIMPPYRGVLKIKRTIRRFYAV